VQQRQRGSTLGRTLRRCHALCVLLLGAAAAFAANAQQRSFRYFDQNDGLRNVAVNTLAQDGAGYVWAGTENGLYRYDGSTFRRFGAEQGLPDSAITSLHADAAGGLWVGTWQGLFRRQDDRFAEVRMADQTIRVGAGQLLDSISPEQILVVSEQKRLLKVEPQRGGQGWVVEPFFSASQIEARAELRAISGLRVGRRGDIWLACSASLCRVDSAGVATWKLPGPMDPSVPIGILLDSRGDVWVNSSSRQLQLPAAQHDFIDRSDARANRGSVHVYTPIVEDAWGFILTRSSDDGVIRWDGSRWETIGAAEGLSVSGGVNAILADRDGGVWLGTSGRGVVRWVGYRHFSAWTTRENLPHDDVWSFMRDGPGRLLIGTGAGTVWLDDREQRAARRVGTGDGADTHQAGSLARDRAGNLWIGTFTGALMKIDARTRVRSVVAALPLIFRVYVDSSGRLWICTKHGVFVIDLPAGDNAPRRVDDKVAGFGPASDPQATDVCERVPGEVWITTSLGLLRWKDAELVPMALPARADKDKPSAEQGMLACGAKGGVWLVGGRGLPGVWQLGSAAAAPVRNEAVSRVLADRHVMSLREDQRGWLWVSTDDGVFVFNGVRSRHLNQDAGLVWNDCNQSALYEDDDGSMWIGTSRGASHVAQPETLFDLPALRVRIESVSRDGQALQLGADAWLPWTRGALTIRAVSLSFDSLRAYRFRHRMLGLDDEWSATAAAEVTYPALSPGHYRYEIMAQNDDLQIQSAPAFVEFEILPPWWRSTVFYGACLLLLGMAAVLFYRWRVRALRLNQARLEELVQVRTRELESSREQMRELALKDGLTGVWNRRALTDLLQTELARALRQGEPLTLVMADADHFKRVNDTFGHLAGDEILKELARRFVAVTRAYDTVGRYGGEEFIIVLPGLQSNRMEDRARIEAFHRIVSDTPMDIGGELRISLTCSFGVAGVDAAMQVSVEELIARADKALYRAKELGRDQIEYG